MQEQEKGTKVEILRLEDVPEAGSLGLLALGYQGLMLWRTRRKQLIEQQEVQNKTKHEEA